jgi:hypothetical protein
MLGRKILKYTLISAIVLALIAYNSTFAEDNNQCPYLNNIVSSGENMSAKEGGFTTWLSAEQTSSLLSYAPSGIQYRAKSVDIEYGKQCGFCHLEGQPGKRTYTVVNSDGVSKSAGDNSTNMDPSSLFGEVADGAWKTLEIPDTISYYSYLYKDEDWGADPLPYKGEAGQRKVSVRIDPTSSLTTAKFIKLEYTDTRPRSENGSAISLVSISEITLNQGTEYNYIIPTPSNKVHIDTILTTGRLSIWHGQNGQLVDGLGAPLPPVTNKIDFGAVTVANINDSDGNGTSDHLQTNVPGEKDLMKLTISGFKGAKGKARLTITSGSVKFWATNSKMTEIPRTGSYLEFDVPTQGLDKTVWVEATAVSPSLRSIVLTLGYAEGSTIINNIDVAKATAIWVEPLTAADNPDKAIRITGTSLSPQCTDPDIVLQFQYVHNSKFGIFNALNLTPSNDFSYSIGFGFRIKPDNVASIPGPIFDMSRQKETAVWIKLNNQWVFDEMSDYSFPSGDLANDDGTRGDEDNIPMNNKIYSIDNPKIPLINNPSLTRIVKRGNFNEFVRVRFDGVQFIHNFPAAGEYDYGSIQGSRCSPFQKWKMRGDITRRANGTYIKTAGAQNVIGGVVTHESLGTHP